MQKIVHARTLRGAAWCALAAASLTAEHARAGPASVGCDAANRGGMNMQVTAGGQAARQATFQKGETLTLNVSTQGTAAITVSSQGGDARTLHSGRASSVMFVAPSTASYGFRLDADAEASAQLDVTCASVARANAERALLDRRKAYLAARDPDRVRIDRPQTEAKPLDSFAASPTDGAPPRDVSASISLSELAAAMKVGTAHEPSILDFWFEGRYTTYDTIDMDARQNDGNFSVMYFGSKYMLGPDIMLGYLAQFDQVGETSRYSGGVSSSGWMAGPYMSVRFGPGVVFDGRAAWGTAETSVPNGVLVDTTPVNRSLMRGTLRGTRQVAGWTVVPSVGLSYVEDVPKFQDTAFMEATPIGTGRLDVLPEMKRRFDLNSETYIEPRIAAGGFLSFDDISRLAPGGMAAIQNPDLHWKAEAGVAVGVKDSLNLQATGGVETGGGSAADTWSGRLQLNMPLGQ
ncbi:autotransporter outer membrane beta-barrel domain-containing protein [Hyphomicrobium sp.]|uniref:autotransporter outer membrane beta-barrel domain-containing protein n=1 Tax=Hyphomicrobium sp. TaxID=82 RepID=UPI0025BA4CAF|nr:autotransporter outer membrane beta-barrel domain-containing protein [Hyphomicrobium sp.]MCC7251832.1 autotransporter outer membrane beta-barrel domain-containing protein [Hyphomicrobium sp.]